MAAGGGTMMELLSVAGTRIVSGRRGGGGVVYLKVERQEKGNYHKRK